MQIQMLKHLGKQNQEIELLQYGGVRKTVINLTEKS
ncbi:MAG: hypothetical protein PG981_001473 [Wolbachia endosymbiont of Ctenocephalides orientis wCori]|nr:MAG: hypothetical protein PG981_001473 [Wolbachia endosymbiont of Ctenocephalides orientis wCori]